MQLIIDDQASFQQILNYKLLLIIEEMLIVTGNSSIFSVRSVVMKQEIIKPSCNWSALFYAVTASVTNVKNKMGCLNVEVGVMYFLVF